MAEAGNNKSKRVYFFHAHPCFQLEQPKSIERALAFRQKIKDAWKDDDRVEVHTFLAKKFSLFQASGNFEVLFTRDVYTDMVTWLEFNRPEDLSILVHPLTDAVVADHTQRAMWLGKPVDLELSGLHKAEESWAQKPGGVNEVDIVMHVHRVQAFPEDIQRE